MEWWLRESEHLAVLETEGGETLSVLDSGRANDGPGPDILGAEILLGDRLLAGEVEMHLFARDWFTHGHGEDWRYSPVILHVVLDPRGGPDLATLTISGNCLGSGVCPGRSRPTRTVMMELARSRVQRKRRRGKVLIDSLPSPEMLPWAGLMEAIAAGAKRNILLLQAARSAGMDQWPRPGRWQGSRRTAPGHHRKARLMGSLAGLRHELPFPDALANPADLNRYAGQLRLVLEGYGLNRTILHEFLVNAAIPWFAAATDPALELWRNLAPARHYGFERILAQNVMCEIPKTVLEQQAWLGWWQSYCQPRHCAICPLIF